MAFFGVTLETIGTVRNHPNADRLDLATVNGMSFQFVVGRDQWKVGDSVLYFPVDSLLPAPIIEKLGLTGKLSGPQKNRVKTIKLRGELSQGLVAGPIAFLGCDYYRHERTRLVIENGREYFINPPAWTPETITEFLGVTKYEPMPEHSKAGFLLPMPDGVSVYDIEGADRYPGVVGILMDRPVCITEKLEGTNLWVRRLPGGEIQVGQRNHLIKEDPDTDKKNMYWQAVRDMEIPEFLEAQAHLTTLEGNVTLTLRGELLGPAIQRYYKGLTKNTIRFFDLQVDGRYVDAELFMQIVPENWRVPVISVGPTLREWLTWRTIQEASDGKSAFAPGQLREGIVIRPLVEQDIIEEIPGFRGRLQIKQRSPEYLAGGET